MKIHVHVFSKIIKMTAWIVNFVNHGRTALTEVYLPGFNMTRICTCKFFIRVKKLHQARFKIKWGKKLHVNYSQWQSLSFERGIKLHVFQTLCELQSTTVLVYRLWHDKASVWNSMWTSINDNLWLKWEFLILWLLKT